MCNSSYSIYLHYIARREFEFTAENGAEAVGEARLLNPDDACAHAPLVHLISEGVRLVREEAELLGSEDAMSARRVDVGNARVDNRES